VLIFGLFDCQRRWLNSLGLNAVPMASTIINIPFHIFWSYFLVIKMDMQLLGTGVAGFLSFVTQLLLCQLYCYFRGELREPAHVKAMCSASTYNSSGFSQFINLAIPSCMVLWCNYWIWELSMVIAGLIGVIDQANFVIVMNLFMLFQMMALGAQQGICALVGKQIGLQDIETARRYQASGYVISVALVLTCAVVLYTYLPSLIGILMPSQQVVDVIANDYRLRLVVAVSFVPDALKQAQLGIVKALGIQ
jgi:Na+-driven multidrug efflux pump